MNDNDIDWEDSGLSNIDYKNQLEFFKQLNPKIKNSIIEYTGDFYKYINDYLDTGKNNSSHTIEFLKSTINNIDLAFKQVPKLNDEIIVYRGLDIQTYSDSRRKTLMLPSYKGKYSGFISTSHDINVAYKFVNHTETTQKKILDMKGNKLYQHSILKITVPKNARVLYLGFPSINPEENEILLPRNSIMTVDSITRYNDTTILLNVHITLPTKKFNLVNIIKKLYKK